MCFLKCGVEIKEQNINGEILVMIRERDTLLKETNSLDKKIFKNLKF